MADPLSPATQELGERIRVRRLEIGATQEEVAYGASIDATTLSKIERGERNPNLHNLIRIAIALGLDAADLVRGMTIEMVPERDRRPGPAERLERRLKEQTKNRRHPRTPTPDNPDT